MNWKNHLLRFGVRLLAKKKLPESPFKRILVVTTTALGDTLWATPTLESLKKSFPNCYLAVLTSPIGFEVLKTNPWIDRIFLLERFFPLRKKLKQEKFDTILMLHTSQRMILPLCATLGASKIVGTKGIQKGLDSLLTDPLNAQYEHEILRRLKMVETIGGSIYTETLSFSPSRQEKTFSLPPGNWIALHPGSKDGFKRWPAKNFAKTAKLIQEKTDCKILITGTAAEQKLMEEIGNQIPGSLILDTKLSLHGFAHVLKEVKLLISNDTGPVHLACAIGCPVIALYGGTDPLLCGPYKAENATAISKPPTCTPCVKRKCGLPFCLLQIGPEQIAASAVSTLREFV